MNTSLTQELPICAFVLAGGVGSRLKSVVSDRPKPMAMVGDRPFLEIIVNFLSRQGISRIVLLTGFMSEYIEKFASGYRTSDITIQISREREPLGTGGAVKYAQEFATDPTLLVNGDTYFEADIASLCQFHVKKDSEVTLSLCEVPDVSRYGSVLLDEDGLIRSFKEKSTETGGPGIINAGFSMISYGLISRLPSGRAFSMEREIFPTLMSSGRMHGLKQKGTFFDIGTPESYLEFKKFVLNGSKI